MRNAAIFGWLLVPALAGAYHYGPGQERLVLDDAAAALDAADREAAAENWPSAVSAYEQALAKLTPDRVAESRLVRLQRARARTMDRMLPEASADLKELVEEMQADKTTDPKTLDGARASLAGAQYYLTWLMKLEGLGREEWEPEIESARQTYRLLAQRAEAEGDAAAASARREDLECAIRLALTDPGELQGRAIPRQCQGCKSGQCKKPGRKPGKKPGDQKPKDARGASSGPPPDNSGS